jgi:hypothetical protein
MKTIYLFVLIIVTSTFGSCTNQDLTLELGNGDDVIVSLEVLDKTGINKIEFQADGNSEVASEKDLRNYKNISFGFDGKGEGTFKVCVYSNSDTICSEHYVEGGYRPVLKCNAKTIDVENHTGIGY